MATGKLAVRVRHHHYGKARVRVLKILRDGAQHRLKEIDAQVLLSGDFEASFAQADNRLVVATDTMKNTVNVLAKDHLGDELEPFALILGRHFLERYPQVQEADIHLVERPWTRLSVDGQPHPHSFSAGGSGKPFTRVRCTRGGATVESGVDELLILKSTGSGFAGFPRDEFTTLPETADRILATSLKAAWLFRDTPASHAATNQRVLAEMLKVFAVEYSVSVQATLHEMGRAALAAVGEISEVTLTMPNQHCLLVNLAPFGRENQNEIFTPTTEPHGLIEATVSRE